MSAAGISGIARMNIAAMSTEDLRRCYALLLVSGKPESRRAAVVEAMAEELSEREAGVCLGCGQGAPAGNDRCPGCETAEGELALAALRGWPGPEIQP